MSTASTDFDVIPKTKCLSCGQYHHAWKSCPIERVTINDLQNAVVPTLVSRNAVYWQEQKSTSPSLRRLPMDSLSALDSVLVVRMEGAMSTASDSAADRISLLLNRLAAQADALRRAGADSVSSEVKSWAEAVQELQARVAALEAALHRANELNGFTALSEEIRRLEAENQHLRQQIKKIADGMEKDTANALDWAEDLRALADPSPQEGQ